jgi:hypothetical protein
MLRSSAAYRHGLLRIRYSVVESRPFVVRQDARRKTQDSSLKTQDTTLETQDPRFRTRSKALPRHSRARIRPRPITRISTQYEDAETVYRSDLTNNLQSLPNLISRQGILDAKMYLEAPNSISLVHHLYHFRHLYPKLAFLSALQFCSESIESAEQEVCSYHHITSPASGLEKNPRKGQMAQTAGARIRTEVLIQTCSVLDVSLVVVNRLSPLEMTENLF